MVLALGRWMACAERSWAPSCSARKLMKAFEDSAGALYCKDLKGVETGKVICSCPDCIRKACGLAADIVYGDKD